MTKCWEKYVKDKNMKCQKNRKNYDENQEEIKKMNDFTVFTIIYFL